MGDYDHIEDWEHEMRLHTRLARRRGLLDHVGDAAAMVGWLIVMAAQLAVMGVVWVVVRVGGLVGAVTGYSRGKSK
jgi:hypothetical protein